MAYRPMTKEEVDAEDIAKVAAMDVRSSPRIRASCDSLAAIAAAMGPGGARLVAQADALRARFGFPVPRPAPGTATPAP